MITTGDVLRACEMHKQSVKYFKLRQACRACGVWLKKTPEAWYFTSKKDIAKVLQYLKINLEEEGYAKKRK